MIHLRAAYDAPIIRRKVKCVSDVMVGAVRTGSSSATIADELSGLKTTDEVDAVYRRHLRAGDVPDYLATKGWWPGRVTVTGGGHVLELLVGPDIGAVGRAEDPYRIGKSSQAFAQEYVDWFNSLLPSQKLLRDIEAQADPKFPFTSVQKGGGADDSVEGVTKANDKANVLFEKAGISPGDRLTVGYRKAYVVRPGLDGTYIAIYGGRWTAAGGLVQPTSGHAHTEGYSDYSHSIVLVSRKAKLDGEDVDLRDLFLSTDPSIVALVSDEGSFDPVFPNAGSGAGKYGYGEEFAGPGYVVSADVASVQRGLVDLGYDVGSAGADGKLGPDTMAAISAFRGDHSLPGGGIDDELVDAINAALLAKFPTAGASRGYATIGAILVGLVAAVAAVWYLT